METELWRCPDFKYFNDKEYISNSGDVKLFSWHVDTKQEGFVRDAISKYLSSLATSPS